MLLARSTGTALLVVLATALTPIAAQAGSYTVPTPAAMS